MKEKPFLTMPREVPKMTKENIKILKLVMVIAFVTTGIYLGMFIQEKFEKVRIENLKASSKVELQSVENKAEEVIGYWQGVYQAAPYYHMIFTENTYKILEENKEMPSKYPVLEMGDYRIEGEEIILNAKTPQGGIERKFSIKLEENRDNEEHPLIILAIGDQPKYFYGRKVSEESLLVTGNKEQKNTVETK